MTLISSYSQVTKEPFLCHTYHMNDDEFLKKRFIEKSERAYNRGIYEYTGFLSPYEQNIFLSARKDMAPVSAALYCPGQSSVRKIAVFGSSDELGFEMDDPVCVVHIEPVSARFAEELSHRDYLGAVLALGIDRELTGDIIIRGHDAWLYVLKTISQYICENLSAVRHTNVKCSMAEGDVPELTPQFAKLAANISSERADLILTCITDKNRDFSKRLIDADKVFINGMLLNSPAHRLKAGDEIVVRGFGKYIYDGIQSTTRKDRINISVRKYI